MCTLTIRLRLLLAKLLHAYISNVRLFTECVCQPNVEGEVSDREIILGMKRKQYIDMI
jgi:hypothetical protein